MFKWLNSKVKKMKWYDISLTKLSTAAFILMIAKLWSGILILDWYWYLVIAIVAAIVPVAKLFKK
jgi:hypothetical protein